MHDPVCGLRLPLLPGVTGNAIFRGEHAQHRLVLGRCWGEGSDYALWVGMNPSCADPDTDDLTVRKEQVWTRRTWPRVTRYLKVNIGTYRWTNSRTLDGIGEPLAHPDNVGMIAELAADAVAIVLTTGKPPAALAPFVPDVLAAIGSTARRDVLCLGVTRDGWPKHSSRLGYATPLIPFLLSLDRQPEAGLAGR